MTTSRQARPNPACLFVLGSDSEPRPAPNGKHGLYPGNNDLYRLLGLPGVPRIVLTPAAIETRAWPDLRSFRCVVNQVSDPDQNPKVLEGVARMLEGFAGRIVNHPQHVLKSTRDRMAEQLADTPGLVVPRVIRGSAGKSARSGREH